MVTTVRVTCPECPHCKESAAMTLDAIGFVMYQNGATIQSAFPDVPKEEREQLITGIHPKCWDEMFPPDPSDA